MSTHSQSMFRSDTLILETNQTASPYGIHVVMNTNCFNQDSDQHDPQVLGIRQYDTTSISIPSATACVNAKSRQPFREGRRMPR